MKKIFRFFRGTMLLIFWTLLFVYITNALFILFWNFDYIRANSWRIMMEYWNSGGVIKSTSDTILVVSLILLPIAWLLGYRRVLKINYIDLLLKPINFIYNIFNRDTSDDGERVVIRNIKSSSQRAEEIKSELSSLKPKKAKETQDIRYNLKEKVSNDLKK